MTTTASGESAASSEPSDSVSGLGPRNGISGSRRHWWQAQCSAADRRRVMSDLAIIGREGRVLSFYLMLGLSVVVAVMGLSADSAAVVIGAMLLAPLMTPVLATAASLSMGLVSKAAGAAFTVFVASIGSIGLSWLLAWAFVPNGPLSAEIIARTRPDIRDLVVALGAGLAGSYATIRPDASSSLPGVAVAVALVPPLATVGIALEADQMSYAQGAALLYVTNLAAVTAAALGVFIVTGLVPPRRLATSKGRIGGATFVVIVALAAVALPLYRASLAAAADSQRQTDAESIIDEWLGSAAVDRVVDLSRLDDGRILVTVQSTDPPLDDAPVREAIATEFDSELTVLWDRIENAEVTTTTTILTDEEIRRAQITNIVSDWLGEVGSGLAYRLDGLSRVDGVWRIECSGVGETPEFAQLTERLDAELGEVDSYLFYWTARTEVDPLATTTTSPLQVQREQMHAVAEAWADAHELELIEFSDDGPAVVVGVRGRQEAPIEPLLAELAEVSDSDVVVQFTLWTELTTSTTEEIPAEGEGPDGSGPTTTGEGTTTTSS